MVDVFDSIAFDKKFLRELVGLLKEDPYWCIDTRMYYILNLCISQTVISSLHPFFFSY